MASSRPVASFTTQRINKTTFVVREDDAYGEHPFIYVKLHPRAPICVLSDTGCDEASERFKNAKYTHLRDYLQNCPVEANGNRPLNAGRERSYVILITHCHYDHLSGISQFLADPTVSIIASAAGKDFITSDLSTHGLFDLVGKPAPKFKVTKWAQSLERLTWPLNGGERSVDLGLIMVPAAGHTPDSMAWYDCEEMHLYVGDSMYEEGSDGMPILFPKEGNLVEYVFQMHKLQYLIRGENGRAAAVAEKGDEHGFVSVPRRVKLGAGHQTHSVDAEEFFERVGEFWWGALRGEVPVTRKAMYRGEEVWTWREKDGRAGVSLRAPKRLMEDARAFFKGSDVLEERRVGSWL